MIVEIGTTNELGHCINRSLAWMVTISGSIQELVPSLPRQLILVHQLEKLSIAKSIQMSVFIINWGLLPLFNLAHVQYLSANP